MMVLGVSAADYHWTGAAGNCLWSDSGNWEKSNGDAVESVDFANPHTYNFGTHRGKDVGWEKGLVVFACRSRLVHMNSFAWLRSPGWRTLRHGVSSCRAVERRFPVSLTMAKPSC